MATRGYIQLVNNEIPGAPYLRSDGRDILIEAYHDGYTVDMLLDVMSIPVKLADLHHKGYGKQFLQMMMFEPDVGMRPRTFSELLQTNVNIGFLDLTWSDILPLLQMTSFGKYREIQPGVSRYGALIGLESASLKISLENGERRLDSTTIHILGNECDDPEELGKYSEELEDYADQLCSRLNKTINHNTIRVVREGLVIKFSITAIAMDLMYHRTWAGVNFPQP